MLSLGANLSNRLPPNTLDFQGASWAAAAKAMKTELDLLVSLITSEDKRKIFQQDMDGFYKLFTRFMDDKTKDTKIDWDKIQSPSPEQVLSYQDISSNAATPDDLKKLAVLKLNGGLGTTMGWKGPKSALEVQDGMTLLDLTLRQIEYLNDNHGVNVPLVLMNSFNTDEETRHITQKYATHNVHITSFNQSRHPNINKESLLPEPRSPNASIDQWYPPGHGDLYEALYDSGLLDQLLNEGKEYLFVSNVDNLGATVDLNVLHHMVKSDAEFLMEVTDKTKADIQGGTLVDYDGNLRLLEIAQVPSEHMEDFKSSNKFQFFNTNNLWINLRAMKRVSEEESLNLDIIVNNRTMDSGEEVIQLETAAGAAIKHFGNAHGVNVPRSRFIPVKSTSDLLLVTSNLYSVEHGQLKMNPKRKSDSVPLVELDDHFKNLSDFLSRFKTIPDIVDLDHLSVAGDVTFGNDVKVKGTTVIVAKDKMYVAIPDWAILEDKIIYGNLPV